jgi:hypothetical protein
MEFDFVLRFSESTFTRVHPSRSFLVREIKRSQNNIMSDEKKSVEDVLSVFRRELASGEMFACYYMNANRDLRYALACHRDSDGHWHEHNYCGPTPWQHPRAAEGFTFVGLLEKGIIYTEPWLIRHGVDLAVIQRFDRKPVTPESAPRYKLVGRKTRRGRKQTRRNRQHVIEAMTP